VKRRKRRKKPRIAAESSGEPRRPADGFLRESAARYQMRLSYVHMVAVNQPAGGILDHGHI